MARFLFSRLSESFVPYAKRQTRLRITATLLDGFSQNTEKGLHVLERTKTRLTPADNLVAWQHFATEAELEH